MDKKKILLIILAVAAIFAIIFGLGGDEPQFSNVFIGDVPNIEVAAQDNIKGVKLICDPSGSMKGYVDFKQVEETTKNNNFKSNVTTLINRVESKYKPEVFTAVCGNKLYPNVEKFRKNLTADNVFTERSSYLRDLIEDGVKYASDSTVSVVLSDMVLSYGAQAIISSKDLKYNWNHLDDLKSDIETAMTAANNNNLHVVVLQYLNDFNGHYYCNFLENLESLNPLRKYNKYDNCLMQNRPYYIMLIGSKENLMSIVKDGCYAKCENMYASFVEANPELKNEVAYNVNTNDSNVWTLGFTEDKSGGFYAAYLKDSTTSFTINCPDFVLPRYYYKDEQSFEVVCNGYASAKVIRYSDNNIEMELAISKLNDFFQGCSKPSDYVTTTLDIYTKNNWYVGCNCNDDISEENMENKTWGLEAFFDGINSAYYHDNKIEKSKVGSLSICFYSPIKSK